MQEPIMPPEQSPLKKEILETIETIDHLQKDSINRFDRPELHARVLDLIQILGAQAQRVPQEFIPEPTADENRFIQDLYFQVKKMQETAEDLNFNAGDLTLQQTFVNALDQIRFLINQYL